MTASSCASAGMLASMLLAAAPLAQGFVTTPVFSTRSLVWRRDASLGARANDVTVDRRRLGATMAIAGPDDSAKVVICGPRDGIAGLVASRLSRTGGVRQVLLADETETLEDQLGGAKVVVGSSDGGPDGDEAPAGLADEIVTALGPSTQYLVWVDTPEGRAASRRTKAEVGVIGELFGAGFKESLEAIRSVEGDIKCVVVHTGRLFGASGGEEPVPFLTGPKAEPVLDESITRQAVLVGPGTVLSAPEDAATKRSSVADAIERFLDGPERRRGVELSVVSVEGFPTTDEEWEEELKRLDDSEGVAVFSIDFDSVEKKDQLMAWLADSWGPSALRKSTAAMLRSGARPVAVSTTGQGVELVWETLADDLTAVQAGKLSIVVNEEPAGLRVVRVAGAGQAPGKALSGEEEIVQSLLQGINTVAYPKALVKRKSPKVSRAAAAAAMSTAASAAAAAASAPAAAGTAPPQPPSPPAGGGEATAAAVEREPMQATATATPITEEKTSQDGQQPAEAPGTPASRKGRGRRSGGKRRKSS